MAEQNLRLAAAGTEPAVELEFDLTWSVLRAAYVSLFPRKETYENRSNKFKRKLFSRNINRIKETVMDANAQVQVVQRLVCWNSRVSIAALYLLFLGIHIDIDKQNLCARER